MPAWVFADGLLNRGRNGQAPGGAVQAAIARAIRYRQHEGRGAFYWWGGNAATTGPAIYTFARPNLLEGGGRRLRASIHRMSTGAGASYTSGVIIDGYSTFHDPGFNTTYPAGVGTIPDLTRDPVDDVVTGEIEEVTIGSDNVHLYAGCVYEDAIREPVPSDTVDPRKFAPALEVVGTQSGSLGSNTRLVDRFDHVWRMRRPVLTWAAPSPNYIQLSESPEEYRYIFDQTVGDGGTAPVSDGPADTLPLYAAGMGRQNTVRVYVFINAAMTGATDGGSIAVANKDSNGNMQAFQALQNPYTFGGTGYAWYPSLGTFDPATAPYFEGPTGVPFDRICIGARSEGSTDEVRIRSLMLMVYPSMA